MKNQQLRKLIREILEAKMVMPLSKGGGMQQIIINLQKVIKEVEFIKDSLEREKKEELMGDINQALTYLKTTLYNIKK